MTRCPRYRFVLLVWVFGLVIFAGSVDFAVVQAHDLEPEFPDNLVQADPVITVWYGNNQTFGTPGLPQRQINILGNVENTNNLSYWLNDGLPRTLSIGSDSRRLYRSGDFVIDLMDSELKEGENTVVIQGQMGLRRSSKP
jgi:hypothetical protein